MEIRKPKREDLLDVIELIFIRSQNPSTASLYCYQTHAEITQEIDELFDHNHPFLGAFEGQQLLGILYGFRVPYQNRIDVSGPFLMDTSARKIADMLLMCFMKANPSQALHFYFDKANQTCENILLQHGAIDQGNEYKMRILRDRCRNNQPSADVIPITEAEQPSFCNLLKRVMGPLYISGAEILEDSGRMVQLYHKNSQICGFIVLKQPPNSDHAFMEMIGINKCFQNQGLGHTLLNHALYVLCENPKTQVIELIVDASNTRAKHLYSSLGFEITQEHKSYVLST